MSNFVLVTQLVRKGTDAWEARHCRVNADRINVMEPDSETNGTRLNMDGFFLRVQEDMSTILFRITQGEKQ